MNCSYEEINQRRTVISFGNEDVYELFFKEVSRIRNIKYPPEDNKIEFSLKFEITDDKKYVAVVTVIDNVSVRNQKLEFENGKSKIPLR